MSKFKVGDKISFTGVCNEGILNYSGHYVVVGIKSKSLICSFAKEEKMYILPISGCKLRVKKKKLSKRDLARAWNSTFTGNSEVDVAEASVYFKVFCVQLGFKK